MPVRPRLKAHARPLRRSPRAVQFGLVAGLGLVMDGLQEAEIELLGQLDGHLGVPELYAVADDLGVAPDRLDLLLAQLRSRHLLVEQPADRADLARLHAATPGPATPGPHAGQPAEPPAEVRHRLRASAEALAAAYGVDDGFRQLAARADQHVAVAGCGQLPEVIARLLADGGVGRVEAGDGVVGRLEHGVRDGALAAPGLVVLVGRAALAAREATTWHRQRVPHLPVVTQDHRVLVGPLVRPGRGPCLTCTDLHRRDRDAAWPTLVNQLAAPLPETAPPVSTESSLTSTAAGLVAMLTHAHLDGLDAPSGVSLEVSLPWPEVVHRAWPVHPACACAAPAR